MNEHARMKEPPELLPPRQKPLEEQLAELQPRVKGWLYSQGHCRDLDTADRVAAAAIEKAWRARRKYDSNRAKLMTWVCSIARNAAIDDWRRNAEPVELVTLTAEHETIASDAPDPAAEYEARRRDAKVRRAVSQLPEIERTCIEGIYFKQWNERELLLYTGLTRGKAQYRVKCAMLRLRDLLAEFAPQRK